jgi:transcriptional regulator with XRE-family HTH domain
VVRTPLTEAERERGRALGQALQRARAGRSAAEVAMLAGVSLDTLRKIERGAIATPAFFTVAALARVLGLDLAALAELTGGDQRPPANPSRTSASRTGARRRNPVHHQAGQLDSVA